MINLVQFPGLGLSLHINRVAISLGGFNIYWYGIILAAGLMGGLLFAFRYGPDRQRSLPTAQGSRRKQQGLALGQCPSPLGRRL